MTGHYDVGLVLLSIFIAVIAAFVTIDLASRVSSATSGNTAKFWLVGGAISMGIGIWAMHFVGMLAFTLPIPMSYDIWITLTSLLVAMLTSGLALYSLSLDQLKSRGLIIAGTLMGVGIATMHYTGMEAMRMRPSIVYAPGWVIVSVAVAVCASISGLWISFHLRSEQVFTGLGKKAAGALVMGLAISAMHYSGMQAASFADGSICTTNQTAFDTVMMATIVSALAISFLMLSLLMSAFVVMPRTIRGRIVLLVAGCMVPVSLMAIAVVGHDYYRGKDYLINSSIFAARSAIATVDKDLMTIEAALLTLATSHLLTHDNLDKFNAQAMQVAANLPVDAITLTDIDGRLLIDTRHPNLQASAASDTSIHLQRLLDIGKPVISDLFVPPDGRPQVKVVLPMHQNGTLVY